MTKPKTILVAPLNWGIGHATRCIPIIVQLEQLGHKVILASDGDALTVLINRFPELEYLELPSYQISYPKSGSMAVHMVKLLPKILRAIDSENKVLRTFMESHKVDVVISDNRYGMNNYSVKSIFVSHQIKIKAPFVSNILALFHLRFLHRFDEVWIPDSAGKVNVSGNLSHNCRLPKTTRFIGVLSQFTSVKNPVLPSELELAQPFALVMISGPEPQRTLFEKAVLQQVEKATIPVLLVGGKPDLVKTHSGKWGKSYPYLNAENLLWAINKAKVVISRAGYSSVMDLVSLQKSAVLVPTPGQTEQEYLAHHLSSTGMFEEMNQADFDLNKAIEMGGTLTVNEHLTGVDYSEELKLVLNNI